MMKILITSVFFLTIHSLYGQIIQLDPQLSNKGICAGSEFSVAFTTSGGFPFGDEFKVQISTNYGSTYQDISVSSAKSPIQATIPNNLQARSYSIRIISTVLKYVSNSLDISVNSLPTAEILNSPLSTNINPYEKVVLNIKTNGGGPWQFVLNDSTQNTIIAYNNNDTWNTNVVLMPLNSIDYKVSLIKNACGIGTVKGAFKVGVNAQGFKIIGTPPSTICIGNKLYINYSVAKSLQENTDFLLEFTDLSRQNSSIKFAAKGIGNTISFEIPDVLLPSYYKIKVRAKNDELEALLPSIEIRPKPTVKLFGTKTIVSGEEIFLQLETSEMNSLGIQLSDGTNWMQEPYYTNKVIRVRPKQTTNYTIKYALSECGPVNTSGNALITVNPMPVIDSISNNRPCLGEKIKIYISSQQPLNANASYELAFCQQSFGDEKYFTVLKIPATWESSGILTAQMPMEIRENLYFGNNQLFLRILRDNIMSAVNPNIGFAFNYSPSFSISNTGVLNLEKPDQVTIRFSGFRGYGPFEVELSDGSIHHRYGDGTAGFEGIVFPNKNTNTYSIKSIKQ